MADIDHGRRTRRCDCFNMAGRMLFFGIDRDNDSQSQVRVVRSQTRRCNRSSRSDGALVVAGSRGTVKLPKNARC